MRRNGLIGLILVSAMFIIGICSLSSNLEPRLNKAEASLAAGTTVIIDGNLNSNDLKRVLVEGDYMTNTADAEAVAQWITRRATALKEIPNLGTLNLKPMKMNASDALSTESPLLRSRVEIEQQALGINDDVRNMYSSGEVDTETTVGDGDATVTVNVYHPNDSASAFGKLKAKLTRNERRPAAGVLVKAREHYYDTINDTDYTGFQGETAAADSVIAYAMTDNAGKAVFHLPAGRYYSFIPVEEGYIFGTPRGTTKKKPLEGDATFNFGRRVHTLTPLSPTTYSRLKEDGALIVRSPESFRHSLMMGAVLFLVGWWGFFIFLYINDKVRGQQADYLLPVILAILSGIGLLAMFSITNPLADSLLGMETAWGIFFGIIGMAVLSSVDIVSFYNGRSRLQTRLSEAKKEGKWYGVELKFDFIRQFFGAVGRVIGLNRLLRPLNNRLKEKGIIAPAGMGYLITAVFLLITLAFLGSGPEGSDAKVNLNIGITFQPSEVCKYLIVVFFSAFFAENAPLIQAFSERLNSYSWKRRVSIVGTILLALLLLCGLYLKLLSDMGPALVVVITFIILYSVARRDLPKLLLGVATFLIAIYLADYFTHSTFITMIAAAGWFIIWVAYFLLVKKQIYESAVYLNLVIAAFMFGSTILGGSEGERLAQRAAIAGEGTWVNTVDGGDQIAQGMWSLATGGLTGQGPGNGNPNLVPAFHTDMVFTSIGEILGWIALVMVLICFGVLVHRSLLLARRAGHPFAFFLISGIALVTGIQFIIIVGGSLGLIPLTGIAVPFLSFGKSSLIINMSFFGLLIALSRRRATANQARNIRNYDNAIVAGSAIFLTLAIIIGGVLLKYQVLQRDKYIVKPVLTANASGAPIIEYNPRIALLMKKLHAGNIYDRNGVPIALASADMIDESMASLISAGVDESYLTSEKRKRKSRYYTFGNSMLFMLGDYNNHSIWNYSDNDPVGYVAENRHLSMLRGFDNMVDENGNRPQPISHNTINYRNSRYLPPQEIKTSFIPRNYSQPRLLEMLKSGNDTTLINKWNAERHTRDLTMTVDARLQRSLEQHIADYVARDSKLNGNKNLRISAVVLDATQGDLLSSANYPLPDPETIKMLSDNRIYVTTSYYEHDKNRPAITDRDLGLTFQTMPGSTAKVASAITGFMAFGPEINDRGITIYKNETVEPPTGEPWEGSWMNRDGGRLTYIDDAIVYSSNAFFVKLIHENHLYDTLTNLYDIVGIGLDNPDEKLGQATPYVLLHDHPTPLLFYDFMTRKAARGYNQYEIFNNRPHDHTTWVQNHSDRLSSWHMALPWGQGGLRATPLAMARIASIAANNGMFAPTRFILSHGGKEIAPEAPIRVISERSAALLRSAMQRETDRRRLSVPSMPTASNQSRRIGGKTGTPERATRPEFFKGYSKYNDAWYICFMNREGSDRPLAVAIRLERVGIGRGYQSTQAVRVISEAVIPALRSAGYKIE